MHYCCTIHSADLCCCLADASRRRKSGTWMTLNGMRVPCPCRKCNGASKDYRTAKRHAEKEAADRPLFPPALQPVAVAEVNDNENKMEDDAPPNCDPAENNEWAFESVDDIVSHVEVLPNCHEPAYKTVRNEIIIVSWQ